MSAEKVWAIGAVLIAAFASVGCKINKDTNCLNPKAGCFKKDTELPSIQATNPVSVALGGTSNPTVSSLSSLSITFSEPMRNAESPANYPKPTGSGATLLNITGITKTGDRSVLLTLSGSVTGGAIDFDLRAIEDLSGNRLTNPQFTITSNSVDLSNLVTSSGGYPNVTVTWKNQNTVVANYQFKIGTADCALPAGNLTTGTNLSGASAGVYDSNTGTPTYISTINVAHVPTNPTTFKLCLTNAGAGLVNEVVFTVGLDDTAPVTTPNPSSSTFAFPATTTMSCADNADKIAYRMNGTDPNADITIGPPVAIGGTSSTYGGSGISIPLPTSVGTRSVTLGYRCVDQAGHIESLQTVTYKAELQWANVDAQSERWDWAHWK